MASRILIITSAILLFVQAITAQCVPRSPSQCPVSLSYAPELSSGGTLAVRSASPISPTGLAVLADQLVIEGPLIIDGQLPFLGTVVLEGLLPSVGGGSVSHSCGSGIGISSELLPAAPVRAPIVPSFGAGRIGAAPLGIGPLSLGARASPLGLKPRPLGLGASPLGLGASPSGLGASPLGLGGRVPGCGRVY